jgi:hypothetical protein
MSVPTLACSRVGVGGGEQYAIVREEIKKAVRRPHRMGENLQ